MKCWSKREFKLLGTMPDRLVAQKIGRSIWCVNEQRRKHSIPRYVDNNEMRSWTRTEDSLLGTMPDKQVAERIHRTIQAIRMRRQVLDILRFRERPWTATEDKRLGTSSDAQIARELARPKWQVTARRRKLRILPFINTRRPWTVEEEQLVGTMPDFKLARKLRRTLSWVVSGVASFQFAFCYGMVGVFEWWCDEANRVSTLRLNIQQSVRRAGLALPRSAARVDAALELGHFA